MKTGKMCKLYKQSKSKSYQAQINQANHWHKFSKEIDCLRISFWDNILLKDTNQHQQNTQSILGVTILCLKAITYLP